MRSFRVTVDLTTSDVASPEVVQAVVGSLLVICF